MTPERRRQITAVVKAALERDAAERESFLDEACGADDALRGDVEAFLRDAEIVTGTDLAESDGGERATSDPADASLSLGHYTIEGRLGAGGMGVVYLARDERLGRRVALKLLAAGLTGDPSRVRRFKQEARAASALNHPNILTIYEIGEFDGCPYIATELVDGMTLRDRLAIAPLPATEAVEIASQMANALAAAHAAGVVHRDVKPENVMVRPDGYVKILDFGIAKLLEGSSVPRGAGANPSTAIRTDPGTRIGTVPYMSPEQARGLAVDARTDVWSLGVVLYEMLTGLQPFDEPTSSDTIAAILGRDPEPVTRYAPDVPVEVDRVVRVALSKPAAARFGRMQEMADELARCRDLPPHVTHAPSDSGASSYVTIAVTETVAPTNLPEPVTTFVGRVDDIAEVLDALAGSRLLTLTGEGGIGKTRLALEVGRAARRVNPDGVWLVELAAITDPALVVQAVASALGIREEASLGLLPGLCAALRESRMLVVLDNCEHLVEACAETAAAILRSCPEVRILATSREALGITGERHWEVRPLSLPGAGASPSREDLVASESARLFAARAKLVKHSFTLTDENAPVIARLCERLEGIALAIELAASKVRVLSPEQILARLDDRLSLLVGGDRTVQPRHRTMRATLAWGYDLLTPRESALLRRLAVFAGGWRLDAAEAVCVDEHDGGVSRGEVFETLTSLADKSFVRVVDRDGSPRYGMLETIREYAHEKLVDDHGDERAHRRHFDWCLDVAAQTEEGGNRLMPPEMVARLADEEDNVRAALRWSIERRNDPAAGLRLAVLLWRYWLPSGRWSEGRVWLAGGLAAAPDAAPSLRARASRCLSALAQEQGDFEYARRLLEETLRLQRERGEQSEMFFTIFVLGRVVERMGDYAKAVEYYEEGLAIAREAGDPRNIAAQLNTLGVSAMERGEYDRARELFAECLDLFRQVDDVGNVAVVLHNLGEIAFRHADLESAARLLDESLALARANRMTRLAAFSSLMLGNVATAAGDFAVARERFTTALVACRDEGDKDGVAYVLEGLARMATSQRDAARAMRLAGAAAALRRSLGCTLPPFQQAELERSLEGVREALGAEAAAAEFAAGEALPLDAAIAFAFETT